MCTPQIFRSSVAFIGHLFCIWRMYVVDEAQKNLKSQWNTSFFFHFWDFDKEQCIKVAKSPKVFSISTHRHKREKNMYCYPICQKCQKSWWRQSCVSGLICCCVKNWWILAPTSLWCPAARLFEAKSWQPQTLVFFFGRNWKFPLQFSYLYYQNTCDEQHV